jgi:hypothetical protein
MLGIEEKITSEVDQQKKAREKSLKSLRSLIEKLKGEIAALGLVGVAKQLTAFDAKIAILKVRLEEFKKVLKDVGEVEILEGLINQLDKLGRTAIIEDKIRDLTNELQKLGQTPLEQKINGINQKIGNMRFELAQTILVLMRTHQVNEETIRWIEKWGEAIDELEKKLRDRLRSDTLRKFAQDSNEAIKALSQSLFDLSASMIQGPIAGGLFGAGERGEIDRLKIQLETQDKLRDAKQQYFDEVMAIEAFEAKTIAEKIEKQLRLIDATEKFETQVTMIQQEETFKRIELTRMEWQERFNMIESLVGGWQQLGETIADLTWGQSSEMEEQMTRQRELLDRGKIDIEQYHDRVKQIERAAQKDREKIRARFVANMIRQAGQIVQQYLIEAAASQVAGASAMASSATMWAAFFESQAAIHSALIPVAPWHAPIAAAYNIAAGAEATLAGASVAGGIALGVAGAAVGVGTGLIAGAIEANNLGAEGGFLGTPTEDVFEDRNRRLGGSIRAQEVHLSINPVTYIQAEGDIFIGEGITVETFKGLVNEAFINRAQDALEEGTLQIDALVNVKG